MQPLFFKSTARTFMQSAYPTWIVAFNQAISQAESDLVSFLLGAFHCFSSHSLQKADSV